MKIRIFADETIEVDLAAITTGLQRVAPSFAWTVGRVPFGLRESIVSYPKTYRTLDPKVLSEGKADDQILLVTDKPYNNEYFWDAGINNAVVISLAGWERLTNLPRPNGIVYFAVAILVQELEVGCSHDVAKTGCVNDFWDDKKEVDAGMRAAYLCPDCLKRHDKSAGRASAAQLRELKAILDDLSFASRANEDIIEFWRRASRVASPSGFDVFMCHNSRDKDAIRKLNTQLKARGNSHLAG